MSHSLKDFAIKLFGVFLFSISFSAAALVVDYSPGTTFKVIQDEIVFDHSTVKSAKVVSPRSVVDHTYRVQIVLNADTTTKMHQLTDNNKGKKALIIVNGYVVSSVKIMSPLSNKFEISGLSKSQAEQLVKSFSG